MLKFLFRGLTADIASGAPLFEALTREARRAHWYVEGAVPDTLNGRFAVLATLTSLTLVRLESDGDAGNHASVLLTERFIEVMESEHRELGMGDPALGRTVRKLVGMLARRTDIWRSTEARQAGWSEATRASLYRGEGTPEAVRHSGEALKMFSDRLSATSLERLQKGLFA